MVRFSIIIPNYNGQVFLEQCISSILSQDFSDYEIIVVDNASSDGSVDFIRNSYSDIRIIENNLNRGYAGGCNDGIRAACGRYILFLNTDTVLIRGFLSCLSKTVDEKPDYGMYAPKVLYPDGVLQAAGCSASISGSWWERGLGCDPSTYDEPCDVYGPYGGAALFSRELLEITGGFDEDFFLFVEETDLTFRARLAGFRCWYEPRAVVIHHHGGTAGRFSDLALYYLHRNVIWYVLKSYPLSLLLLSFPFFIGRNTIAVINYMIQGRGSIVIQAKKDAILRIPEIIRKRRMVYRMPGMARYNLRICHFW